MVDKKGLWGRAFWKDALERTISAVCQSLLLFLTGDALGTVVPGVQISVDFSDWRTWLMIIAGSAVIQMLKNIVAVTANPNSGASFGTTIPATLVQAYTTVTGGDTAMPAGTLPHPGDTVAGPAAEKTTSLNEGEPVYVQPVPPSDLPNPPADL